MPCSYWSLFNPCSPEMPSDNFIWCGRRSYLFSVWLIHCEVPSPFSLCAVKFPQGYLYTHCLCTSEAFPPNSFFYFIHFFHFFFFSKLLTFLLYAMLVNYLAIEMYLLILYIVVILTTCQCVEGLPNLHRYIAPLSKFALLWYANQIGNTVVKCADVFFLFSRIDCFWEFKKQYI